MIKPYGKRLLVRRAEVSLETESGIIIPDSVKDQKVNEGKVIAVGSDEIKIKEGDHVIFGDYSGNEVEYEGLLYLVIYEVYIFALL